jgi:RimJ/RimL family protein N-acetyltransferase
MAENVFIGQLVRLAMVPPEEFAVMLARSGRDVEFKRLIDSEPLTLYSKEGIKKWFEQYSEKGLPEHAHFMIRTLEDDRLIGDVDLDGMRWSCRDCYVGIGIDDREFWGKGFGTDAMRLALRYAFTELDLQRVTLNVFEYNPRAIRSYEKVGFKHEGRQRFVIHRDGRRWDILYMGILKTEWLAVNGSQMSKKIMGYTF